MCNKFILNNGSLKLGEADLFFQLAKDHSTTRGGGLFHIDVYERKIWLYDESIDFGPANIKDIKRAIRQREY